MVNWLFNVTINDISVIYVTEYYVSVLTKKLRGISKFPVRNEFHCMTSSHGTQVHNIMLIWASCSIMKPKSSLMEHSYLSYRIYSTSDLLPLQRVGLGVERQQFIY